MSAGSNQGSLRTNNSNNREVFINIAQAPAGSYTTGNGSGVALCAPGTYNGSVGRTSCSDASPGYHVASAGATSQAICAAGTYSATEKATSCTPARIGFYVGNAGQRSDTACQANTTTVSTGSTGSNRCIAVPGYYIANYTLAACPAGSYSAAAGATSCTQATAGNFVGTAGATGQTACAAGSYSATARATSCTQATAGSFVGTAGATTQTACAAGSYSASAGATS
jgi:hypothetical protein